MWLRLENQRRKILIRTESNKFNIIRDIILGISIDSLILREILKKERNILKSAANFRNKIWKKKFLNFRIIIEIWAIFMKIQGNFI